MPGGSKQRRLFAGESLPQAPGVGSYEKAQNHRLGRPIVQPYPWQKPGAVL